MKLLYKAKYVRLRSHHGKFLHANSDEKTVFQHRDGSCKSAKWGIEFGEGMDNVVRLKSWYGKYLMATNEQFLLGVTGLKVVQNLPMKLDSSIEWEPIKVSSLVKFKTSYGKYLRANGGLPPFRNSVTHDVPFRHQDWILWEVDIIELLHQPESIIHNDRKPPNNISQPQSLHVHFEPSKSISQQSGSLDHDTLNSSFRFTFSRSSNFEVSFFYIV